MELTSSYKQVLPADVLRRYTFAETRNAAKILHATNLDAFAQFVEALREFHLTHNDLVTPGGQESDLAARMNNGFRSRGWREARVDTLVRLSLTLSPWGTDTAKLPSSITETINRGYKVDNFRGRVALDVEWNAKDGNLDRDISAYRALYDAALIDMGVLISRTLSLRDLARKVGLERGMPVEKAKRLLNTTTTTNDVKLIPRLTRGDAGGCPVLAIFICNETAESGGASVQDPI